MESSFHLRRIGRRPAAPDSTDYIHFVKPTTLIGRNRDVVDYFLSCHGQQGKDYISRTHARVIRSNAGSFRLVDSSLTGVYVNDMRIEGGHILCEGDTVTFGHPTRTDICPGTKIRQPNSLFYFLFERCHCAAGGSPADSTAHTQRSEIPAVASVVSLNMKQESMCNPAVSDTAPPFVQSTHSPEIGVAFSQSVTSIEDTRMSAEIIPSHSPEYDLTQSVPSCMDPQGLFDESSEEDISEDCSSDMTLDEDSSQSLSNLSPMKEKWDDILSDSSSDIEEPPDLDSTSSSDVSSDMEIIPHQDHMVESEDLDYKDLQPNFHKPYAGSAQCPKKLAADGICNKKTHAVQLERMKSDQRGQVTAPQTTFEGLLSQVGDSKQNRDASSDKISDEKYLFQLSALAQTGVDRETPNFNHHNPNHNVFSQQKNMSPSEEIRMDTSQVSRSKRDIKQIKKLEDVSNRKVDIQESSSAVIGCHDGGEGQAPKYTAVSDEEMVEAYLLSSCQDPEAMLQTSATLEEIVSGDLDKKSDPECDNTESGDGNLDTSEVNEESHTSFNSMAESEVLNKCSPEDSSSQTEEAYVQNESDMVDEPTTNNLTLSRYKKEHVIICEPGNPMTEEEGIPWVVMETPPHGAPCETSYINDAISCDGEKRCRKCKMSGPGDERASGFHNTDDLQQHEDEQNLIHKQSEDVRDGKSCCEMISTVLVTEDDIDVPMTYVAPDRTCLKKEEQLRSQQSDGKPSGAFGADSKDKSCSLELSERIYQEKTNSPGFAKETAMCVEVTNIMSEDPETKRSEQTTAFIRPNTPSFGIEQPTRASQNGVNYTEKSTPYDPSSPINRDISSFSLKRGLNEISRSFAPEVPRMKIRRLQEESVDPNCSPRTVGCYEGKLVNGIVRQFFTNYLQPEWVETTKAAGSPEKKNIIAQMVMDFFQSLKNESGIDTNPPPNTDDLPYEKRESDHRLSFTRVVGHNDEDEASVFSNDSMEQTVCVTHAIPDTADEAETVCVTHAIPDTADEAQTVCVTHAIPDTADEAQTVCVTHAIPDTADEAQTVCVTHAIPDTADEAQTVCVTHAIPDTAEEAQTVCVTHVIPDTAEESDNVCVTHAIPDTAEEAQTVCVTHVIPDTAEESDNVCVTHAIPDMADEAQTVCVTHTIPDTADEAQTVCVTHAIPDTAEESYNICGTHAIPDMAEEAQTVCVTHAIPDTAEEAWCFCVTHAIPDTAEESDNVCVTHAIPDTADEAQTVCVTHTIPDTADEAQTVCVTHAIPDTAEEAQTVCVTHAIPDTAEESDNVCVTHAIPDTAEESDNVCGTHAILDTAEEAQAVCVTHAIPDMAEEAWSVCVTRAIPDTAEEAWSVCVTHAIPDTAEESDNVCVTHAIPDTAEESDNVCVTHAIPDMADEAQTVCVTHAIPDTADEAQTVCVTHAIPDMADEAQTVCVTHAIPDTAEEAQTVYVTHAIPDTAEESDNVCVTHAIPDTAEEAQTVCVTHAIPDTAEESDNVCVTHAIPDTAEEAQTICGTHAIPDTEEESDNVCVTHAIPDTAEEAQTVCVTHAIPETAEEAWSVCGTHAIPDMAEESDNVCVTHAIPDTAEESDNVCVTYAIPDTADEAQTVCVTHAIPDTADEAQTVCVTHAIPDTAEEAQTVCVTHAIPDTAEESDNVCVTYAIPDTADEAQTVCVTHAIPDTAEEAQTVCVTHAICDMAEEAQTVCGTHAIPDTADEAQTVCVTHAIPDTAEEAQTVCVTHVIPDTADEAQTVCVTHTIPDTAEEAQTVCVTHAIPETAEEAQTVCVTHAIPDTANEAQTVCVTHVIPDTAEESDNVCVTHAIPDTAEESDNVCGTHAIPDMAEEAQTVCVTHAIPDTAEEAQTVCVTHTIPDTADSIYQTKEITSDIHVAEDTDPSYEIRRSTECLESPAALSIKCDAIVSCIQPEPTIIFTESVHQTTSSVFLLARGANASQEHACRSKTAIPTSRAVAQEPADGLREDEDILLGDADPEFLGHKVYFQSRPQSDSGQVHTPVQVCPLLLVDPNRTWTGDTDCNDSYSSGNAWKMRRPEKVQDKCVQTENDEGHGGQSHSSYEWETAIKEEDNLSIEDPDDNHWPRRASGEGTSMSPELPPLGCPVKNVQHSGVLCKLEDIEGFQTSPIEVIIISDSEDEKPVVIPPADKNKESYREGVCVHSSPKSSLLKLKRKCPSTTTNNIRHEAGTSKRGLEDGKEVIWREKPESRPHSKSNSIIVIDSDDEIDIKEEIDMGNGFGDDPSHHLEEVAGPTGTSFVSPGSSDIASKKRILDISGVPSPLLIPLTAPVYTLENVPAGNVGGSLNIQERDLFSFTDADPQGKFLLPSAFSDDSEFEATESELEPVYPTRANTSSSYCPRAMEPTPQWEATNDDNLVTYAGSQVTDSNTSEMPSISAPLWSADSTPTWATCEGDVKRQMSECLSVLQKISWVLAGINGMDDPTIEEWRTGIWALQLQASQLPKTHIAVIGDTGAGKSSLLNALLDLEDVLPTSSMRACTAVVVEISKGSQNSYKAEVEFLSEEEWDCELTALLADMRDKSGKFKKRPDSKPEARVAYSRVMAVYGLIDELEVLKEDKTITKYLGTVKHISENSASALRSAIERYIDSSAEENRKKGGKFWPVVKCVRVFVPDSEVLRTGAVLVDLPGTRDSNAARDRIAKEYLKKSDVVWVVANITRAVDDKTAKDLLSAGLRRQLYMDGHRQSMAFICTKTDMYSVKEIKRALDLYDETCALEDKVQQLDHRLSAMKVDKQALYARWEERKDRSDMEDGEDPRNDFLETEQQIQFLEEKKEKLEKEIHLLCVRARNDYSKQRIRSEFQLSLRELEKGELDPEEEEEEDEEDPELEPSQQQPLRVFTVSSKAYLALTAKVPQESSTRVFCSESDTEIPDLRDFALETALRCSMSATERVIREMSSIISQIITYLTNRKAQDDSDQAQINLKVGGCMKEVEEGLSGAVRRANQEMKRLVNEDIAQSLAVGVRVAEQDCVKTVETWGSRNPGGYSFPTYKAACSRQGLFHSPTYGVVDFNEQLSEPMSRAIAKPWAEVFSEKLLDCLKDFSESVLQEIERFFQNMRSELQSLSTSTDTIQFIHRQQSKSAQAELVNFLADQKDYIISRQRNISRVLSPAVRTGMISAYLACESVRGEGSFEKMKATIIGHVRQHKATIFSAAAKKLMEQLDLLLTDIGGNLQSFAQERLRWLSQQCQSLLQPLKKEEEFLPDLRNIWTRVSWICHRTHVDFHIPELENILKEDPGHESLWNREEPPELTCTPRCVKLGNAVYNCKSIKISARGVTLRCEEELPVPFRFVRHCEFCSRFGFLALHLSPEAAVRFGGSRMPPADTDSTLLVLLEKPADPRPLHSLMAFIRRQRAAGWYRNVESQEGMRILETMQVYYTLKQEPKPEDDTDCPSMIRASFSLSSLLPGFTSLPTVRKREAESPGTGLEKKQRMFGCSSPNKVLEERTLPPEHPQSDFALSSSGIPQRSRRSRSPGQLNMDQLNLRK